MSDAIRPRAPSSARTSHSCSLPSSRPSRRRRSSQGAARPWSWFPGTTVTPPARGGLSEASNSGRENSSSSATGRSRISSTSPSRTTWSAPATASTKRSRTAGSRATSTLAQQSEVQVGDHGESHRRDGGSRTSLRGVSRFCRHNRLSAECPICSKGTVLDPARRSARKARPALGRGPSAPSRGGRGRLEPAWSLRGRRPLRRRHRGAPRAGARGAQAGGVARRADRPPGARARRRRPSALLADAAEKGLLAPRRAATAPPPREGELRHEPGPHGRVARRAAGRADRRRPRADRPLDPAAERGLAAPGGAGDAAARPLLPGADGAPRERGVLAAGGTVAAPGAEDS